MSCMISICEFKKKRIPFSHQRKPRKHGIAPEEDAVWAAKLLEEIPALDVVQLKIRLAALVGVPKLLIALPNIQLKIFSESSEKDLDLRRIYERNL